MTMFCQKAKIKISLFLIDGQHFHENTKTVKNMLKKVFILFLSFRKILKVVKVIPLLHFAFKSMPIFLELNDQIVMI